MLQFTGCSWDLIREEQLRPLECTLLQHVAAFKCDVVDAIEDNWLSEASIPCRVLHHL